MLRKVDVCRYERGKLQRFYILQNNLQKLLEHTSLILLYLPSLCSLWKTSCNICLWNIMSLNKHIRDEFPNRTAFTGFVSRDLNADEQAPLGSLTMYGLCKVAVRIDSKGKKIFLKVMALYGRISETQKITPIQEQSEQNTLNNWECRVWKILYMKTGKI